MKTGNYKLISLIEQFVTADKEIRKQKNVPDKIKVWKREFVKPNKKIISAYFDYVDWVDEKKIKNVFSKYNKIYNSAQIIKNEQYIKKNIDKIIQKISKVVDLPKTDITIILNIGVHYTNGFVVKYNGRYSVFVNLEHYSDSQTLKTFLVHEIAHAIQLLHNPKVYYWNKEKKRSFQNHILLEGFASFVTKKALKISSVDALEGKIESDSKKRKMIKWFEDNKDKLKPKALKLLNTHEINPFYQYFGSNKPKNVPYIRMGYYFGLDFIEYLVNRKSRSIKDVMLLNGNKLNVELKNYLNNYEN